jgi:uncharacterized membrane protein YqhA
MFVSSIWSRRCDQSKLRIVDSESLRQKLLGSLIPGAGILSKVGARPPVANTKLYISFLIIFLK